MKYTKYDKFIDESYPKERQAVYEKLKKELGLPDDFDSPAESRSVTAVQKPASRWHVLLKKPARLIACISAMAVVCLAIILPFITYGDDLQATTPNPGQTTPPTLTSTDRFYKVEECKEIGITYSLKEYSELNSLSLLYVNWYDMAEIKTSLHVDSQDQADVVYFEEILVHKGTGSIVELYITDVNTKVDKVENYKKGCLNSYIVKRPIIKVFWGADALENGEYHVYKAYFTFGKYDYAVVLRYPVDENSIFDLIDSMLPINRK